MLNSSSSARRAFVCLALRAEPAHQATCVLSDEFELTFAGFAVFRDPPKASAGAALAALTAAGVDVKVLTGDNEQVARHLCDELGFDPRAVLTGTALATLSEEALIGRLPDTRLFCRVTPQQKLRVIMALKRTGQTVGFLGDGINDAPALHAADVGISVDSAADVAKAAAEIILLEQDLGVVYEGVMEGRRTVVNTGKYILMASSANFGNIFSMVLAGLILPFLPLLPIQVLLTNLIYDVAQAGLPVDNVDAEAVMRPLHWDLRLIERFMLVMGPVSTLFDVITFFALLMLLHANEAFFRTGWFVESLVTQILMIFAVRTRRSLFASRPHRAVTGLAFATAALTLALPFLPGISQWFEFVRPPTIYFAFLLVVVAGFLVTIELAKRIFFAHMVRRSEDDGRRPQGLRSPFG
jgi:P-type Mg2+ transporter